MTANFKIEQVNYFGERTNSNDFNAKVLYRKNSGKLQLAQVYIDFFNRHVFVSQVQDKSCKVLKGFDKAINDYAEGTEFRFQ